MRRQVGDNYTIDDFFKQQGKEKRAKVPGRPRFRKNGKTASVPLGGRRVKTVRDDDETTVDYPAKYKVMSAARAVFWTAFFAAAVYGAVQFIYPPRPRIIREEYIPALSESDTVKAFALQYAKDYMTYDGKKLAEYRERMDRYAAQKMTADEKTGWSLAVDAEVYGSTKLNAANSAVTVYVKALQGLNESDGGTEKEVYIKVPVRVQDEKRLCVFDYPIFVHPVENSGEYGSSFKGETADDKTRAAVKEMLDNFFRIYQNGSSEQISYFLTDVQKIKGYAGQYQYDGINALEVFDLNKDATRVFAMADIKVRDSAGSVFKQKYNFIMVKKEVSRETRWYIERFIDSGSF